jgi:PAX-interacting protein 1
MNSFKRPFLNCPRRDQTSPKYKKAREWKVPIVNVQWLSELVMGHFAGLQFPGSFKYQDFSAEEHFRLDYSLVPELMGMYSFF